MLKKMSYFFVAAVSVFLLISCQKEQDDHLVKVGFVHKGHNSHYWQEIDRGMATAAKEYGITIVSEGSTKQNNVDQQIDITKKMVNKGVEVMIVAPVDASLIIPALKNANAKNIPVIIVDDTVKGAEISCTITTNNYEAGYKAGKWMAEKLQGKGKVVLLNGKLVGSGKDRAAGFEDAVKPFKDIEIVYSKDCGWDIQEAEAAFRFALKISDQIDGVFSGWDGGALAAHKVLKEKNMLKSVLICGFDCYPEALQYMKEGTFAADIAQKPYEIGYQSVVAAHKIIKQETVESYIETGTVLVNRDNLEEYLKENL